MGSVLPGVSVRAQPTSRIDESSSNSYNHVMTMRQPFRFPFALVLLVPLVTSRSNVVVAQVAPSLTAVQITVPVGTFQQPFRTNRPLLSFDFNSDAAGGSFFATSEGADIPMSIVLPNGGAGRVGGGFISEGFHQVRVRIDLSPFGNPPNRLTAISDPVIVVFDRTPPSLAISTIRLGPDRPVEAFDPNRVYRTNADSIQLRGIVNDGNTGVPADQITIETNGVSTVTRVNAMASGIFVVDVDISQEPDGSIDLRLVANDNVVSPREGNRSEVPVGLR